MIIQSKGKAIFKIVLPIAVFAAALSLFTLAVSEIAGKSENEGIRLMEESIKRAAVQCYALEGVYPADFEYLKEHYALRPDESKYVIYYTYTASNLMPGIDVLPANAETAPDPADGSEGSADVDQRRGGAEDSITEKAGDFR
jgi:hypothetical protein